MHNNSSSTDSSNNVNLSPTDSNTNVNIVNSTSGSDNHAGAISLPPSVKDSGGRVFRATKQTKHNKSAKPNKKPEALDPRLVPDRPALPNSATSAAHANSPLSANSIMHDTPFNNIFNNNILPNATEVRLSTPVTSDAITFESFQAKRRRLLSRPFATALANTNLLHHNTGGTIRASTPDVGPPAATSGLGTSDEMEWLTRMFHPPN